MGQDEVCGARFGDLYSIYALALKVGWLMGRGLRSIFLAAQR